MPGTNITSSPNMLREFANLKNGDGNCELGNLKNGDGNKVPSSNGSNGSNKQCSDKMPVSIKKEPIDDYEAPQNTDQHVKTCTVEQGTNHQHNPVRTQDKLLSPHEIKKEKGVSIASNIAVPVVTISDDSDDGMENSGSLNGANFHRRLLSNGTSGNNSSPKQPRKPEMYLVRIPGGGEKELSLMPARTRSKTRSLPLKKTSICPSDVTQSAPNHISPSKNSSKNSRERNNGDLIKSTSFNKRATSLNCTNYNTSHLANTTNTSPCMRTFALQRDYVVRSRINRGITSNSARYINIEPGIGNSKTSQRAEAEYVVNEHSAGSKESYPVNATQRDKHINISSSKSISKHLTKDLPLQSSKLPDDDDARHERISNCVVNPGCEGTGTSIPNRVSRRKIPKKQIRRLGVDKGINPSNEAGISAPIGKTVYPNNHISPYNTSCLSENNEIYLNPFSDLVSPDAKSSQKNSTVMFSNTPSVNTKFHFQHSMSSTRTLLANGLVNIEELRTNSTKHRKIKKLPSSKVKAVKRSTVNSSLSLVNVPHSSQSPNDTNSLKYSSLFPSKPSNLDYNTSFDKRPRHCIISNFISRSPVNSKEESIPSSLTKAYSRKKLKSQKPRRFQRKPFLVSNVEVDTVAKCDAKETLSSSPSKHIEDNISEPRNLSKLPASDEKNKQELQTSDTSSDLSKLTEQVLTDINSASVESARVETTSTNYSLVQNADVNDSADVSENSRNNNSTFIVDITEGKKENRRIADIKKGHLIEDEPLFPKRYELMYNDMKNASYSMYTTEELQRFLSIRNNSPPSLENERTSTDILLEEQLDPNGTDSNNEGPECLPISDNSTEGNSVVDLHCNPNRSPVQCSPALTEHCHLDDAESDRLVIDTDFNVDASRSEDMPSFTSVNISLGLESSENNSELCLEPSSILECANEGNNLTSASHGENASANVFPVEKNKVDFYGLGVLLQETGIKGGFLYTQESTKYFSFNSGNQFMAIKTPEILINRYGNSVVRENSHLEKSYSSLNGNYNFNEMQNPPQPLNSSSTRFEMDDSMLHLNTSNSYSSLSLRNAIELNQPEYIPPEQELCIQSNFKNYSQPTYTPDICSVANSTFRLWILEMRGAYRFGSNARLVSDDTFECENFSLSFRSIPLQVAEYLIQESEPGEESSGTLNTRAWESNYLSYFWPASVYCDNSSNVGRPNTPQEPSCNSDSQKMAKSSQGVDYHNFVCLSNLEEKRFVNIIAMNPKFSELFPNDLMVPVIDVTTDDSLHISSSAEENVESVGNVPVGNRNPLEVINVRQEADENLPSFWLNGCSTTSEMLMNNDDSQDLIILNENRTTAEDLNLNMGCDMDNSSVVNKYNQNTNYDSATAPYSSNPYANDPSNNVSFDTSLNREIHHYSNQQTSLQTGYLSTNCFSSNRNTVRVGENESLSSDQSLRNSNLMKQEPTDSSISYESTTNNLSESFSNHSYNHNQTSQLIPDYSNHQIGTSNVTQNFSNTFNNASVAFSSESPGSRYDIENLASTAPRHMNYDIPRNKENLQRFSPTQFHVPSLQTSRIEQHKKQNCFNESHRVLSSLEGHDSSYSKRRKIESLKRYESEVNRCLEQQNFRKNIPSSLASASDNVRVGITFNLERNLKRLTSDQSFDRSFLQTSGGNLVQDNVSKCSRLHLNDYTFPFSFQEREQRSSAISETSVRPVTIAMPHIFPSAPQPNELGSPGIISIDKQSNAFPYHPHPGQRTQFLNESVCHSGLQTQRINNSNETHLPVPLIVNESLRERERLSRSGSETCLSTTPCSPAQLSVPNTVYGSRNDIAAISTDSLYYKSSTHAVINQDIDTINSTTYETVMHRHSSSRNIDNASFFPPNTDASLLQLSRYPQINKGSSYSVRSISPLNSFERDDSSSAIYHETPRMSASEAKQVLNDAFKVNQYPKLDYRQDLADYVGFTETRVNTWFKNRRQREKKLLKAKSSSPPINQRNALPVNRRTNSSTNLSTEGVKKRGRPPGTKEYHEPASSFVPASMPVFPQSFSTSC